MGTSTLAQTRVLVGAGPVRGRLVALDGLRGLAALIVVFHHVYQIARPFLEPTTNAWAVGSLWWVISSTPVKLLSAGSESVLVFFVLSGVVVPLPLIAKGARAWVGFFFGRLVRLYVPVWGALVLSGVWLALVPRPASAVTAGSWVERTNATTTSLGLLFSEGGLMRNSFSTDSVLWSLRWEILFSITLPLFLLVAIALRRFWMPAVVAACSLTFVGKLIHVDALLYLPVFFLGTLLAVNLDAIRDWAQRIRSHPRYRTIGWFALGGSLVLIVASWMLRPVLPAGTTLSDAVGSLTPLGALGLVFCAITFSPVTRGLSLAIPQWLGRISFSLYLTHLPILVALVYLFGDRNWGLVALVGIPAGLGMAALFSRLVELPSHRLARRVSTLTSFAAHRLYIARRARHVARRATT